MPSSGSDPALDAVARRISGSLLRLRVGSPFFAALSLFARFLPRPGIATACTDGRDVFYNPAFLAALPSPELDAVLLHEVLHAALLHIGRRGSRERTRWSFAAEVVVNGIVAAQPRMKLPDDAVRAPLLEHLSVEEIYALIPPADVVVCLHCLDPAAAPDPRESVAIEAHWQLALRHAAAVTRSVGHGELPAGFERLIGELDPQIDWRAQLWRFLARTPTDFGDFDRRFIHRGLYLETLTGESLRACLAVDTSGSINGPLLTVFAAEVRGILGAYPHIRAELYYADTALYGPFELDAGAPLPAPIGGGGTCFEPFFEHVKSVSMAGDESVLIYLTDGHGSFPAEAPPHPVLWVVPPGGAPDEAFPFGSVVRLIDDGLL